MWPSKHKYDVFISHAVEDKIAVANELCRRLEQAGLRVWYSGKELMPGDSLDKTIDRGLKLSRYGVVVLSRRYLEKNWTMREFYALLAKEITHRKVIIPVRYDITIEELQDRNMEMADRWLIDFTKGMDFVVTKILEVIKPVARRRTFWEWVEEHTYSLGIWMLLVFLFGLLSAYLLKIRDDFPPDRFIHSSINQRVSTYLQVLDRENEMMVNSGKLKLSTAEETGKLYSLFQNLVSNYRNEYEFDNGINIVRGKKNVDNVLSIDAKSLTPFNNYSFTAPLVYFGSDEYNGDVSSATYSFINTRPAQYEIIEEELVGDGLYEVKVTYLEKLRAMDVVLTFPGNNQSLKKHKLTIKGFSPLEKYLFEKRGEEWVLSRIE